MLSIAPDITQCAKDFDAPELRRPVVNQTAGGASTSADETRFLVPADRRLLGLDLNECEVALTQCPPVVTHKELYARLFQQGISGMAINGRGPFDALAYEAVVFLPGCRFEFARDLRDASGAKTTIIIPAHGEYEGCLDLVAFDPETGQFATWRGTVAMLGQEQLATPTLGEPITIHPTIPEWLRAGRKGVFIIDADRARTLLAGRRLAVANVEFGLRLRDVLLGPEPEIFVTEVAA